MDIRINFNWIGHSYIWPLILIMAGCGGGGGTGGSNPGKPVIDTVDYSYLSAPAQERNWLKAADLLAAKIGPASPLNNAYFMPIGVTGDALHSFSGSIYLKKFDMNWLLGGVPIGVDQPTPVFPDVGLQFVSNGGNLIPLNREIQVGPKEGPNATPWSIILEPGKVWSEASDNGWSRASFPFELVSDWRNEVHNGLATFIYNSTSISALRLQIVQETDASLRGVDMWTTLTATYTPENFSNADAVIADYKEETASYWPVKSWNEIAPQLKVDMATFNSGVQNEDISLTGVVWNGVVYRQPCYTRYGDYPYCQQMRGATNSAAKSMGAAVALLRLAQKYGDDVVNLHVKDYVTVTATHDGWDNVTFLDALNMATGIGNAGDADMSIHSIDVFLSDENAIGGQFINNPPVTTAKLLNIAFSQAKHSWGPGVVARYDSLNTFVLSAAMDSYLKSKEGPNAHLWDMMVNEVYHPIGIKHVPVMTTEEDDVSQRLPLLYFGLYPTADDVAKIAQLFQNNGSFKGQQILSPGLVRRSLYKTADQGLQGPNYSRYLMSFWSDTWNDGKGCTLQIPYMSGYGGIDVELFPNGATEYRFSDAGGVPNDLSAANLGNMCP